MKEENERKKEKKNTHTHKKQQHCAQDHKLV